MSKRSPVNRSLLDDPQLMRAFDKARTGAVGDVVAVEIVRGAAYPPYEGGQLPPWSRDAGNPFRDAGAPCLHIIQSLLGPIEDVQTEWRSTGGDPNLAFDDWRASVRCQHGRGQLQLTFAARPVKTQLTIHGTKGVLRASSRRTRDDDQRDHGGSDDAVAQWVDKVARAAETDYNQRLAKFKLSATIPFLVTGGSGNLGRATVQRLREQGHHVRVIVRRIPEKPQIGVEYCIGNLGDPETVDRAVRGAETVIHCGAATKGDWTEHRCSTVMGTQNVVDACRKHGVKQLVHISSMSVIDWAGAAGNGPVTETTPTEPRPEERGAYTRAKLEAEKLVIAAAAKGLPCVILRPGQIFGGGIPLINGAVARNAAGRWLVLGDGKLELPLVYIDDVVDAIIGAVDRTLIKGEVIQIIDPDTLTQADVLGLAGGNKRVMRVPRPVVFALGKLSEFPLGALGKQSPIGAYRLRSALARLHYDSDRAQHLLGWKPRVGVREGIRRVM